MPSTTCRPLLQFRGEESVSILRMRLNLVCFSIVLLLPLSAAPQIDRKALSNQVKGEFTHAWQGYKTYASGHDELLPVSHGSRDWYEGQTLYMTPVDTLDALLIMGMKKEADETRALLAANLTFDKDIQVKNFEITIRILGGLLSSYEMTNDQRLLAKAEDLGNRLLPVFNSPTGMPYMNIN